MNSSLYPIKAAFPLTPVDDVGVQFMLCLRKLGHMDTVRATMMISPEKIRGFVGIGSPIRLSWGTPSQQDHFIGYVHSLEPKIEGYRRSTDILAVSAAYPMFNQSKRSFNNVAIHNVLEEIANEYRFNLDADSHPLRQQQILQFAESDWAFVQRLARNWDYVAILDDVTLVFRSRREYMQERRVEAVWESTAPSPGQIGSAMLSYEPSYTVLGQEMVATSSGGGVDPQSGKPILWNTALDGSEKKMFSQVIEDRPIVSQMEGELVARDSKDSLFPYTARAVFVSPYRVKPMDCYQIIHEGVGITWTVLEVKHIASQQRYIGEMVLGSDGTDALKGKPLTKDAVAYRLERQNDIVPIPQIVDSRPYFSGTAASVLVEDQRWRAETMRVYIHKSES